MGAAAAAMLFMAACGDDEKPVTDGGVLDSSNGDAQVVTDGGVTTTFKLGVLHAVVGAPPVDVFAGTTEVVDNLAFGGLANVTPSTEVGPLDVFAHTAGNGRPAGDPLFSVTPTGVTPGASVLAIANGDIDTNTPANVAPVISVFVNGFETDAANARLRVVHASPDAPSPVSVGTRLNETATAIQTPLLVSSLAFRADSGVQGVQVPPLQAPGAFLGVGGAANSTTAAVRFQTTGALPAGLQAYVIAAGSTNVAAAAGQRIRLLVVGVNTDGTFAEPAAILPIAN